MASISRASLVEIIENALKASGIPQPDADALRSVAHTTSRITNGLWEYEGVGCPLTQIGVQAGGPQVAIDTMVPWEEFKEAEDANPYIRFYDSFDDQIREWWVACRGDGPCVPPRVLSVDD
jgi:hypothetical protein